MDDVIIVGSRLPTGRTVVVVWVEKEGDTLRPREDVRNHSPDGFEWGYQGSGPAQLALAILCEVLGDDAAAEKCYQHFKRDVVCRLPWHGWSLTRLQVWEWWLSGAVPTPEDELVDLAWEGS